MIPQPCAAFILLYKVTENIEKFRLEEEERLKSDSRAANVFWMKQTIGNACGTIGIIHALGNVRQQCQQGLEKIHTFWSGASKPGFPSPGFCRNLA